MRFYADLHIHSRYSRACSRDSDLEHLAWWAGRKGIAVVGTGDFTHPAWREELGSKLVPAEPGMYRLRPDLERAVLGTLPPGCRVPARFVASSEISTIYKRDGRTRKVHHLLYAPSLDAVDAITAALARVGNLAADGRPILGLDSRDLLEITLSGGEGCYLVPAHAWTPWFAVLGSQSGFDRIADCYADLAGHVFAMETGLSSDPQMNWRVSSLDQYRLVSNSDAHSPPMLGREATAFSCGMDYFGIYRALRTGEGLAGTVEFFPEEGKYHLDGHRACAVRMTPGETRAAGGRCPECGKPPTIGVQHRVDALADRPEGYRPDGAAGFASLVPLPEILSEIAGVGPKTKAVAAQVTALVERFGPELAILGEVPVGDLAAGAPSIVAEAIARLRRGEVRREAGFDGVYGTIRLFEPAELAGAALFDLPREPRRSRRGAAPPREPADRGPAVREPGGPGAVTAGTPVPGPGAPADGLDPQQRAIVTHDGGPLLVVAGPGAGKTRVLTRAIAHRIDGGLPPGRCLAVTFTRRARDELRERLTALVGGAAAARIAVATFHGLGLLILREQCKLIGLDAGLRVADERTRIEVLRSLSGGGSPAALGARIAAAKRSRASSCTGPARGRPAGPPAAGCPAAGAVSSAAGPAAGAVPADPVPADLVAGYDGALRERGMVDVDDLVTLPVLLLAESPSLAAEYRSRWTDVFVDEYQDVDETQYLLLRLLTAPGSRVCAIGDPDQAIYGFRGGDVGYFLRFAADFGQGPGSGERAGPDGGGAARPVTMAELSRSYRSAPTIVRAAMQLIRPGTLAPGRELVPARADIQDGPVAVQAVADEREEADAIAAEIEELIGGASFHALDSFAVDGREGARHQLSFADFAVLYRTSAQAAVIGAALARRGFPFQQRSHGRLAELPGVAEILAAMHGAAIGAGRDGGTAPVAGRLAEGTRAALAACRDDAAPDGGAGAGEGAAGAERRAAIRRAAEVLGPLADRCGTDLDRFLDELALGAEADTRDPRADRIALLTLHAAKGLEFPVVFIAGCDDGLLPLRPWPGARVDRAEERRLLFVGMTRATTRLVLLTAAERTLHGAAAGCSPSPFLSSVDPALLDRRGGRAGPPALARRRARGQQGSLF